MNAIASYIIWNHLYNLLEYTSSALLLFSKKYTSFGVFLRPFEYAFRTNSSDIQMILGFGYLVLVQITFSKYSNR